MIAAAVIAGADPKKCYGIELDAEIANIARDRLELLGVPRCNIRTGSALDDESYNFDGEVHDILNEEIFTMDIRAPRLRK